jgi:hypothetical protein
MFESQVPTSTKVQEIRNIYSYPGDIHAVICRTAEDSGAKNLHFWLESQKFPVPGEAIVPLDISE